MFTTRTPVRVHLSKHFENKLLGVRLKTVLQKQESERGTCVVLSSRP